MANYVDMEAVRRDQFGRPIPDQPHNPHLNEFGEPIDQAHGMDTSIVGRPALIPGTLAPEPSSQEQALIREARGLATGLGPGEQALARQDLARQGQGASITPASQPQPNIAPTGQGQSAQPAMGGGSQPNVAQGVGGSSPNIGQPPHGSESQYDPRPTTFRERARAAIGGVTVGQLRSHMAQSMIQEFEVRDQVRTQKAVENLPRWEKQVVPDLKPLVAQIIKKKEQEAKQRGELYTPSYEVIQEAGALYDQVHPDSPITQVDMDTFVRTPRGAMAFIGQGLLPLEESMKLRQFGQEKDMEEKVKFRGEIQRMLQPEAIFAYDYEQGPVSKMGGFFPEQAYLNQRGQDQAALANMTPEEYASNLTKAPLQRNPDGSQALGRIDVHSLAGGFGKDNYALLKAVTDAEQGQIGAQATLPAEMAKLGAQEGMKSRLEEQRAANRIRQDEAKAAQRQKEITARGQETVKAIQVRGQLSSELETQKSANRSTYRRLDADLNNDRDRAKGRERMQELQYKIANRPEGTALGVEEKAALALLNGAMAGGRVNANNAARAARQLATLAQADEKTVFSALVRSGAVSSADMMEAARRADEDLQLNPEKKGSLTHGVFSALQDIQAERSLDPFTDAIDFAIGAPKAEQKSELVRLINRWETKAEKAKTPKEKAMWGHGVKKAELNIQRLDAKGGATADKGNSIFESSSQAVKDVLLAKPGDKMHTASYKDVADAIDEVQHNKIEVALGRFTAVEDQKNVKAAGEIFAIIDKMKSLGQDLFTDSTFLRLSGIQGAKMNIEKLAQQDTRIKEYLRLRKGLAGQLSRAAGGERGMMTEGDIDRALSLVPDPTDLFPDSQETFLKTINGLEGMVIEKVRARYDQRAIDALRSGSTGERQTVKGVEDVLAEARRRVGIQ